MKTIFVGIRAGSSPRLRRVRRPGPCARAPATARNRKKSEFAEEDECKRRCSFTQGGHAFSSLETNSETPHPFEAAQQHLFGLALFGRSLLQLALQLLNGALGLLERDLH